MLTAPKIAAVDYTQKYPFKISRILSLQDLMVWFTYFSVWVLFLETWLPGMSSFMKQWFGIPRRTKSTRDPRSENSNQATRRRCQILMAKPGPWASARWHTTSRCWTQPKPRICAGIISASSYLSWGESNQPFSTEMSHEKVARDCLHAPKCLFKCREVFLLCRSNPELDKCVCESEYDCFKRGF